MKTTKTNHFWYGVGAALGVNAAIQDFYGLDSYIAHVRADWITLSPWWSVALTVLVLVAHVAGLQEKRA